MHLKLLIFLIIKKFKKNVIVRNTKFERPIRLHVEILDRYINRSSAKNQGYTFVGVTSIFKAMEQDESTSGVN